MSFVKDKRRACDIRRRLFYVMRWRCQRDAARCAMMQGDAVAP